MHILTDINLYNNHIKGLALENTTADFQIGQSVSGRVYFNNATSGEFSKTIRYFDGTKWESLTPFSKWKDTNTRLTNVETLKGTSAIVTAVNKLNEFIGEGSGEGLIELLNTKQDVLTQTNNAGLGINITKTAEHPVISVKKDTVKAGNVLEVSAEGLYVPQNTEANHYTPLASKGEELAGQVKNLNWGDYVVNSVLKDSKGHVVGGGRLRLPANPNTDMSVTDAAHHYSPAEDTGSALDAVTGGPSKGNGAFVVTGLKRDTKGHVVGVTSGTLSIPSIPESVNTAVQKVTATGTAPLTLNYKKTGTTVDITGTVIPATNTALGVVKGGTTSGKTYGVSVDSTGAMTVNVPWTDTTYTADKGVKKTGTVFSANLKSETPATQSSAAAVNTSGRQYPVVLDKDNFLSVNIPWTDNNTQYKLIKKDTANAGSAASYSLVTSGTAGTATDIDIPKDMMVQRGDVYVATAADVTKYPDAGLVAGKTYIRLWLSVTADNPADDTPLWIPADSLVDTYTSGNNYITINGYTITLNIANVSDGVNTTLASKVTDVVGNALTDKINTINTTLTTVKNDYLSKANGGIVKKPVTFEQYIEVPLIQGVHTDENSDGLDATNKNYVDNAAQEATNAAVTTVVGGASASYNTLKDIEDIFNKIGYNSGEPNTKLSNVMRERVPYSDGKLSIGWGYTEPASINVFMVVDDTITTTYTPVQCDVAYTGTIGDNTYEITVSWNKTNHTSYNANTFIEAVFTYY